MDEMIERSINAHGIRRRLVYSLAFIAMLQCMRRSSGQVGFKTPIIILIIINVFDKITDFKLDIHRDRQLNCVSLFMADRYLDLFT